MKGIIKKGAQALNKASKAAKKKVSNTKKKVVASLKTQKKTVKKKIGKIVKKRGKVFTKARKLKNNLTKKEQIDKLKTMMKKEVLSSWNTTKSVAGNFLKGAGEAALTDVTFNVVKPKHTSQPTVSYKVGEVFGHTVATIAGVVETAGSVAIGTGGVALSATGVGALAGAPISAVAVAGAAHGTAVATQGTQNLVQSAKDLYNFSVNNGGKSTKASTAATKGNISAENIVFSDKFKKPAYKNQVQQRGWNNESIAKTINNPYKTDKSVNKHTGNSVTVYFKDKTHYVAVDNGTGKVIQVSNLNKADWKFDPTFSK